MAWNARNREGPTCMYRVATICTAVTLSLMASAASASPTQLNGPTLPLSAKTSVVYKQWNELVRQALDGDAVSATEIGRMYSHGTDAPHDVPEAMRWLSRAVDLGSNEARRELGLLLLKGEVLPRIRNMLPRCCGKPLMLAMPRRRPLWA